MPPKSKAKAAAKAQSAYQSLKKQLGEKEKQFQELEALKNEEVKALKEQVEKQAEESAEREKKRDEEMARLTALFQSVQNQGGVKDGDPSSSGGKGDSSSASGAAVIDSSGCVGGPSSSSGTQRQGKDDLSDFLEKEETVRKRTRKEKKKSKKKKSKKQKRESKSPASPAASSSCSSSSASSSSFSSPDLVQGPQVPRMKVPGDLPVGAAVPNQGQIASIGNQVKLYSWARVVIAHAEITSVERLSLKSLKFFKKKYKMDEDTADDIELLIRAAKKSAKDDGSIPAFVIEKFDLHGPDVFDMVHIDNAATVYQSIAKGEKFTIRYGLTGMLVKEAKSFSQKVEGFFQLLLIWGLIERKQKDKLKGFVDALNDYNYDSVIEQMSKKMSDVFAEDPSEWKKLEVWKSFREDCRKYAGKEKGKPAGVPKGLGKGKPAGNGGGKGPGSKSKPNMSGKQCFFQIRDQITGGCSNPNCVADHQEGCPPVPVGNEQYDRWLLKNPKKSGKKEENKSNGKH